MAIWQRFEKLVSMAEPGGYMAESESGDSDGRVTDVASSVLHSPS